MGGQWVQSHWTTKILGTGPVCVCVCEDIVIWDSKLIENDEGRREREGG